MKKRELKVLCVGDVVGDKGVRTVLNNIVKYEYDFAVVNIENSNQKGGRGVSEFAYTALGDIGVNVFTGGNHSFDNKRTYHLYDNKNLLRPCNFPSTALGRGHCLYMIEGQVPIVVINVQLRVFMREHLACPFRAVESIISLYKEKNAIIIVDVHGEATAEKISFAAYFDGKVSAIFCTHTHIQTADSRIMPKGTGYITDVGMVGVHHASLGIKFECTTYNFLNQMPTLFELEEEGEAVFSAIIYTIDVETRLCTGYKRIYDLY
jgi:metallophosphoesterase (TIGR00282 family)